MLTFIHVNGQKEIVARWLFDMGLFHVVAKGKRIYLLDKHKWNMYF